MNSNINSSGLYDVNAYNLTANNATILSTLNVNGNVLGSNNTLFQNPITCISSLNVSGNSNLNNLNVSGTTRLNNNTTCISSLNVSGITTFNNYTIMNGDNQIEPKILLSGQEYQVAYQTSTDGVALLLGINRVNSRVLFIGDSTKLAQNATNPIIALQPNLGRFDCISTDSTTRLPASFNGAINTDGTFNVSLRSTLYVSGTTILNNITTINSSLNVMGAARLNNITTINSSLNVSGPTTLNNVNIQGNLNVSGTTTIIDTVINNTSFNSLSVSGPSIYYSNISCNSSLNVSGTTRLNNVTCNSSLNVSGTTILNNHTTINAPLYINTNQNTTISALSIDSTSLGVLVNVVQKAVWNDGVNYALNVTGYSMFGGIQINGQDSNHHIYKRIGDLTIASHSLSSIILKLILDFGKLCAKIQLVHQ